MIIISGFALVISIFLVCCADYCSQLIFRKELFSIPESITYQLKDFQAKLDAKWKPLLETGIILFLICVVIEQISINLFLEIGLKLFLFSLGLIGLIFIISIIPYYNNFFIKFLKRTNWWKRKQLLEELTKS